VVGHATLARAVVVQNVTEPKPALIHQVPPGRYVSGGIAMYRNCRSAKCTKSDPKAKSTMGRIPAPGLRPA
jgi:hypothetical protein